MNHKILTTKEGKSFYIKDISKDYHCQFGFIKSNDLKKKDGSIIKTNTKKELKIFTADFIDSYKRIKRGAQIITRKDIGLIVAETGINKNSKVVDAGAGSGALACFLANLCKEVTTYDIREDFIKIVEHNKEFLNLKNLKIKNKNIYKGIDEKQLDLITLDLPEPWLAIPNAKKSLKIGGFLISYSPTIPQVMDFVNTISKDKDFMHVKTVELIQREWEIEERKVRPITTQTVHTGFLSFIRRV
ncbi:MAG: methyltransferase domain-containing protein [Nanoarchaeota archaeon]|nr:methyltransferase domain-containing protein [Nanoarchaeota archaeon]MBU1005632.1 methyltransferase domain-containing protein [Nanoarchaeota archaeon]MBU1946348.1 methyltransferase domain-containing protein [Nanoarchaeota archaeon]